MPKYYDEHNRLFSEHPFKDCVVTDSRGNKFVAVDFTFPALFDLSEGETTIDWDQLELLLEEFSTWCNRQDPYLGLGVVTWKAANPEFYTDWSDDSDGDNGDE